MSVESGVVDANVLVYAMDADAPHHAASRALLEAARDPVVTLFVTSQILCEFDSVVTNARRVSKPRSSADALNAISNLLAVLRILPVPAAAVGRWMDLLRRHPVIGGEVRFANRRDHASERNSADLYLQHRRLQDLSRTHGCETISRLSGFKASWLPGSLVAVFDTLTSRCSNPPFSASTTFAA